jgi:pimeloyl-ACP methyl ester carboxylesterase
LADFSPDAVLARTIGTACGVPVGAHDLICGPKWGRKPADGIPGVAYAEFANSGHMPHIEEPREFDAAVREVPT